MKKLVNQVINEIFRQMTITLTLPLDVPVRPMEANGLKVNFFLLRKNDLPFLPSLEYEGRLLVLRTILVLCTWKKQRIHCNSMQALAS